MTDALSGRTIVMSGGSRGIGLAIAVAAGRRGANVVVLAKTDQPDPRLPGTVHTAVEEIEQAGGKALAVVGDVRREEDVERAVAQAVERFGAIDVVVNNASALNTSGTLDLPPKRFDLMQQINSRGTFCSPGPRCRTCSSPTGPASSPCPRRSTSPRTGWAGSPPTCSPSTG